MLYLHDHKGITVLQQQVVTIAHASSLLGSTCRREIVMAESCSEALSREIFFAYPIDNRHVL